MSKILIVDDEPEFLNNLEKFLSTEFEVEAFSSPHDALEHAKKSETCDIVISDYKMPGMDGVAFLTAFKGLHPNTIRIIVSAYDDQDQLIAAINEAEIYRFISKPVNLGSLLHAVRRGLIERQLLLENDHLNKRVTELSEENRRLREKRRLKSP